MNNEPIFDLPPGWHCMGVSSSGTAVYQRWIKRRQDYQSHKNKWFTDKISKISVVYSGFLGGWFVQCRPSYEEWKDFLDGARFSSAHAAIVAAEMKLCETGISEP